LFGFGDLIYAGTVLRYYITGFVFPHSL